MRAVADASRGILNLLSSEMLKFDDYTFMAEAHMPPVSLRTKLVSGRIRPLPPFHRARLGPGAGETLPLFSLGRGLYVDKSCMDRISVATACMHIYRGLGY